MSNINTTRQTIGDCFTRFCQTECSAQHPQLHELELFNDQLRKVLPDAEVNVVYRLSQAQEPYFYKDFPNASCSRSWIIKSGGTEFLVPLPVSPNDFDTLIDVYNFGASDCQPKKLQKMIPAILEKVGQRWSVAHMGGINRDPLMAEELVSRSVEPVHEKPPTQPARPAPPSAPAPEPPVEAAPPPPPPAPAPKPPKAAPTTPPPAPASEVAGKGDGWIKKTSKGEWLGKKGLVFVGIPVVSLAAIYSVYRWSNHGKPPENQQNAR